MSKQSYSVPVEEMLQAGVHFGHKTSKKHPKMDRFIFGERKNINIINLESTQAQLEQILPVIEELVANHKVILFLGTKRQAQAVVKATAEAVEMPYITERWLGGLITNYGNVGNSMKKLTELKTGKETGEWDKRYNKKERLVLEREIERLDRIVGGIENMDRVPDALFVVDGQKEKTAVREAQRRNIPVFAITDTNVNPDHITYPIPANDDGVKSITYILEQVQKAVEAGKKRAPQQVEEAPENSVIVKKAEDNA